MQLEREKRSMVVNGEKKKKKKTAAKSGTKKTGGKKAKGGKKTTKTTGKRRRSQRRRNPGIDLAGSGLAFLGGAIAGAVAAPAAMGAEKATKSRAAGHVAAAVAPLALGVGVQLVSPAIGKGIVAGAGAVAADRVFGEVGALRKAGFAPHLPLDVVLKDGKLLQVDATTGKETLLVLEEPALQAVVTSPDGSQAQAGVVGRVAPNRFVVRDANGQLRTITANVRPLAGVQPVNPLAGVQPVNPLGNTAGRKSFRERNRPSFVP